MAKIKLPKLHLACAKDSLRPVMEHILITKDEIVATDAHIIAILKTEDIFSDEFIAKMPERFLVHKAQWRKFYNGASGITFKDNSICAHYDGYNVLYEIKAEDGSCGMKYPKYKEVIPNKKDLKPVSEVGVNSLLLKTLVEAMRFSYNENDVKLQFSGADKVISVTPIDKYCSSRGFIMPVMILD